MPDPKDFAGIPNRDATASIRGYVYQIYQSVLAWMLLAEDDVLILEGAEDFDVHTESSVVTTQVKREVRNVTLRSEAVVDAIQNFWTHQQSNDEFCVVFRFLTTADPGCEQGAPFGPCVPGLNYWESAAKGIANCEPLRQFLLTLPLNTHLLDFIRLSSNEELRERLLKKIRWDLGARDKDAIEANIEAKLKVHGFHRKIGTLHSIRVLPHLLKQVADTLSVDGPKRLCLGDFLSCFDEATTEVIPRAVLEALQSSGEVQRLISMQDNSEMTRLVAMPPTLGPPIPKVTGAIPRSKLVSKVMNVLTSTRVVFLHGSSGLGKTNLASLVTEEIGGTWFWAGFRGRPPDQVQQGLARAAYEVAGASIPTLMVLDDMEFVRISQFERELIALIFAVTQQNGLVLITGIIRPPLHLLPKLWLSADCEISVPYFDETEVNELLATHGLSDSNQRDSWARVILLSTSGHPQLVHARTRTLCSKNWPHVSLSDLTKTEDIERVRLEARQRLLQDFPSEATRLLAYRLSVVAGAFSRKLALAVGAAPTAIQMAGEAFDHLVGPWIELKGEDRYRVSPLLAGAAENTLTPNEIKTIHIAIARDYLHQPSLNQYEVGMAFFHAFLAKDIHTLVVIANVINTQKSKNIAFLYDAISWFPHISLESGQRLVGSDTSVDLMLRLAQFKLVMSSAKTEDALKIIDRMEELLSALEDSDQKQFFEPMVYGIILNTQDLCIPSQTVIRMLSRFMDAVTKTSHLKKIYENFERTPSFNHVQVGDNRPEQLLFSLQAVRIHGLDDLTAMFTALAELPKKKRDSLLAIFNSDSDFAALLIGRAWWSDLKDGNLDFAKAIAALQYVELTSRRWGAMELVRSCQIAISVIYDEYGHSAESALAVLDKADIEFPNAAELINQRSKVLFHANRKQEALAFAERALSLPDLPNVPYVYTCRDAGITAANLKDLAKATYFFELGAKRALQSSIQKPMGIGLMADAAICYWKQNKQEKSISTFVELLELLDSISIADDIKLHHLHATVRHCISWIHFEATKARSQMLIPPPGMCSNQEPHEEIKNHRIVDISATWLLLYQTERAIGVDCGIEARAERFSEAKQPLVVANYKRTLDFEAALRTPPWDGIVPAFVRMQESVLYSKKLQIHENEDIAWQPGKIPPLLSEYWEKSENWSLIYRALLAACVNCLAHHPEQKFPITHWRQDLAKLGTLPNEVSTFLDVLEGARSDTSLYQEVGAGLVALSNETVTVEALWKVSFQLLNVFELIKQWAEKDIEVLITKCWELATENQRFAFKIPTLAIPAIKTACKNEILTGLAKVAAILMTAEPYLSIRVSPKIKTMLEKIAAD